MIVNGSERIGFVLQPHHCVYYWDKFRWKFEDKFQRYREDFGFDTHVIWFHTDLIGINKGFGQGIEMFNAPFIEFHDRNVMIKFKLGLPG